MTTNPLLINAMAAAMQERFAPWRLAFTALTVRVVRDPLTPLDDPAVWLEFDFALAHRAPGALARALEAIELFILLERADRIAWTREATTLNVFDAPWSKWGEYVCEPRPLPRVVGYKIVVHHLQDLRQLCDHWVSAATAAERRVSDHYVRSRTVFEQAIRTPDSPVIAMGISLNLTLREYRHVWNALPAMVMLGVWQTSMNCRIRTMRSRFTSVDFSMTHFAPATDVVFEQLLHLLRLGVEVTALPQFTTDLSPATAVPFVKTLKAMLGSQCRGLHGRTHTGWLASTPRLFAAIASATPDATALRTFHGAFVGGLDNVFEDPILLGSHLYEPDTTVEDRQTELRWMAYALIKPHATTSTMREVCLNCVKLALSDVATLQELLDADDPVPLLFDDLHESIKSHQSTRISASRIELFDPMLKSGDTAELTDARYDKLRVLGMVGEWWIVLLPGWGKAWVHVRDAHVTQASRNENESALAGVKTIEHLELLSPRDRPATTALLELVGKNTTRLKLIEVSTITPEWCADIFRVCTGLKELHVSGLTQHQLPRLMECIATSPAIKLERLIIKVQWIVMNREVVHELTTILEALADRNHPLSKRLRGFGYTADGVEVGTALANNDLFKCALDMLNKNERLDFFRLAVPIRAADAADPSTLKFAFGLQHGQKLPLWANQLGVREKAAFISVVKSDHSTGALRMLDRDVMTNILDFAPKPRFRCVQFEVPAIV